MADHILPYCIVGKNKVCDKISMSDFTVLKAFVKGSEVTGRSHDYDNMANVVCPDHTRTTHAHIEQRP